MDDRSPMALHIEAHIPTRPTSTYTMTCKSLYTPSRPPPDPLQTPSNAVCFSLTQSAAARVTAVSSVPRTPRCPHLQCARGSGGGLEGVWRGSGGGLEKVARRLFGLEGVWRGSCGDHSNVSGLPSLQIWSNAGAH
eukprot:1182826-Prorocentrum_minimum.AAC.1